MKTIDNQYEITTIKSVSGSAPNWTFEREDGWSFSFTHKNIVPKVGDSVRFYGKGTGYTVRGLFVNGKKVFYRTKAQQVAKDNKYFADQDRKRKLHFKKNRKKYETRIAALPEMFRNRINGFRKSKKEFDVDHLGYELFTCEQAVVIATALKTADAIARFYKLDYAVQKTLVPGLDACHSGNTFGCACALAKTYLEDSSIVPQMHGALCPLVGCRDYGCRNAATTQ